MIHFDELLTTQSSIRNFDQVHGMAEFVKRGGIFSREELDSYAKQVGKKAAPLVQLNRFEDGKLYILDGHHRAIGILEGGRCYFHDDEYEVIDYTYQDFIDIVFKRPDGSWMGWITPFDPRIHVRLPEFGGFKEHVRDIYETQSPKHAEHYILTSKHLYLRERAKLKPPVDTVVQIRDVWRKEAEKFKHVA